MSTHHYVLINKSGKQANRADRKILALKLHAKCEYDSGRGGGLIDLLQPQTSEEQKKLDAVARLYTAKKVRRRSVQMRKKARDTVHDDHSLIATIGVLYERKFGHDPSAIQTKKIAAWVATELQNISSELYEIIERRSAVLYERQRPGWWEKQFAARRRRQKSKTVKTAS